MVGINVKITMVEKVLAIVAPHPCSGCGKTGTILCNDCKYDIVNEPFFGCILCGRPESGGICRYHNSPIKRAYVVGERTGPLKDAINRLKFHHTKGAAYSLASLMNDTLPIFPPRTQVVPIPTVASHVRQRGYDQALLIAGQFAYLRSLPVVSALLRVTSKTQHIVSRAERREQAGSAFKLDAGSLSLNRPVLLIDDIITTGATLQSAAKLLRDAGFVVWVAALAYQPLD